MNSTQEQRPVVLVAEALDEGAVAWLSQRAEVVEAAAAASPERFDEALRRAVGLVVRTYTNVDETLLAKAPQLRVVARAGSGLDNIDVEACSARGVQVVHTPGANADAVAELVAALALDALRPRPAAPIGADAQTWSSLRRKAIAARELGELRVGVLGLGHVGSRVAGIFGAFGCSVFYHDIRVIPTDRRRGARPVSFRELLEGSELLTIHVDDRPGNRGLIGERELALLRDDALLVNTSRGFVVDERALAQWLAGHPRAQAALDVYAVEPIPRSSPLAGLPNARLLPHIGAATRRAHRRMSQRAVEALWEALVGRSA